ncbi:hypothetical protein BSKO_13157 [Bryopsis sp. KO-2023]|nr:hypothetical protein BSKO_13157 [Bryopsis sp. KO-2023]
MVNQCCAAMEDDTAGETSMQFDDSDDDFEYEEVEVTSEDGEEDDQSEDLDAALRTLKLLTEKVHSPPSTAEGANEEATCQVTRRPEVVDDFIRNFCVKMGLEETLNTFEAEWYEMKATGRLKSDPGILPDAYLHNAVLEEQLQELRAELSEARVIAERASSTWDKFRKERDFHRMHHKRVAQEKNKLITDIKRLKAHYSQYEPTITELRRKYETAMKEKMLLRLDRDKLTTKIEATEAQLKSEEGATLGPLPGKSSTKHTQPLSKKEKATGAFPPGARQNPFDDVEFDPVPVGAFALNKTFKGHLLSVANLALHPEKPILVSASDDKTWRMWHLPEGQLIMSGEGHKDWVAGIDFHPHGACLASGSGDATVKIWDFEKQKCVHTFHDQKAVWSVKFHDLGDVLASGSLDHTARLWDVVAGKCKIVLRGHVDSINEVAWEPFTSNLCTASSDKTISIWDARSGLCAATFYGHSNSCNHCTFNLQGGSLATTDADGVVKIWDVRMVAEIMSMDAGEHPANKCAFDRSGKVLSVASDDALIRNFNTTNGELINQLAGHEDSVQAVIFDNGGQFLVSAGSDNTFRYWS